MFESAEVGHKLEKSDYEKEVPRLREALLNAQYDLLAQKRFAVLVVLAGIGGGGRSEVANRLNEWMDPRHIDTHAFEDRDDSERDRPPMWRYWQAVPSKGRIGVFLNAWYHELLAARAAGRIDNGDMHRALEEIRHFETMLADEGLLLVKVWFHLSRDDQKKRLKDLLDNPLTRWRVSEDDEAQLKIYNRFRDVAEQALRETSSGEAPWMVVGAGDPRYRDVAVGRILVEAMRERLSRPDTSGRLVSAAPVASLGDNVALLRGIDLTKKLEKKEYQKQLVKFQERLALLTQRKKFNRRAMVAVFEGLDAAGKGSSIRRITYALDARQYTVVPISAPTEEERAQPYLWRFWRRLPSQGHITIFDRSWYGRLLVERVEALCSPGDWMRAYREINDFEEQLLRSGTILVKFWLHISKEEQLRRFKAREQTVFKRFKITPDDWRNRKKWNAYEEAAADMIERTSTEIAPWTIVESEDKYYGRVKILRTLVKTLQDAL
jgi:AMP-polyphosphate phosphotransferase